MSRYDNVVQLAKAEPFGAPEPVDSQRAKHLVFVDPASQALLSLLDRVSPSDAAIHVTGETGTGKELVARYIHRQSRRTGPFLAVNCGAISEHLAESEFFGHEAGAFTGANSRREGWFEAANGGTLFLDEIGDMPAVLQGKLLRALQEGEVTRVGARKPTAVDVRIVSATNVNLDAAVDGGRFRRDLFYRLNLLSVAVPALRDRPGDIVALAEHFATVHSLKMGRRAATFSPEALVKLHAYHWPGNIRELENVVRVSLLMSSDDTLLPEDVLIRDATPPRSGASGPETAVRGPFPAVDARPEQGHPRPAIERIGDAIREGLRSPGNSLLRDIEKRLIDEAFRYTHSNQVRTAELLGVSRNVVRTLLKRYGLIAGGGDAEEGVDCGAGFEIRREGVSSVVPCH